MNIFVTGGSGFIGSALIRHLIANTDHGIINIDKLTYAANQQCLRTIADDPRYHFVQSDIAYRKKIRQLFLQYQPDAVIHLAAETHVDRSIDDPDIFVTANVLGTQVLLQCARTYWQHLPGDRKDKFRFLYTSTDEVYGSRDGDEMVNEEAPYKPNSPYAASKAAATHLVNSYFSTYHFPALIAFSSNNYGPCQHDEKLIAKTISHALNDEIIPLYGRGLQKRDWIYVEDHVKALLTLLEQGQPGQGYNISGDDEISNIELVKKICRMLDQLYPKQDGDQYRDLITFVEDRPGHDHRYGIDDHKIREQLDWEPEVSFDEGLRLTIKWHLEQRGLGVLAEDSQSEFDL